MRILSYPLFVFIILFSVPHCDAQTCTIFSDYENLIFKGVDNPINLQYDTNAYDLEIPVNDSSTLKIWVHNKRLIFLQTQALGFIELNLTFHSKDRKNSFIATQTFYAKPIPLPRISLDGFYSGDTMSFMQLMNLKEFRISYPYKWTIHSFVHQFSAVFVSNKDPQACPEQFTFKHDFAEFKKWLMEVGVNGGVLLIYDLSVKSEGVNVPMQPIQFFVR